MTNAWILFTYKAMDFFFVFFPNSKKLYNQMGAKFLSLQGALIFMFLFATIQPLIINKRADSTCMYKIFFNPKMVTANGFAD